MSAKETFTQTDQETEEKIAELETALENCNSAFNHRRPGSILLIPLTDGSTRLRFSLIKQQNYDASKRNRDVKRGVEAEEDGERIIDDVYNIRDVDRLFNTYARNGQLEGIKFIRRNYVKGDRGAIITAIENIKKFTFSVKQPLTHEEAVHLGMIYRTSSQLANHQQRPKLFEYYCAYRYGFKLFDREAVEMLGLVKADSGCDIISIADKKMGQCKYYKTGKVKVSALDTFMDFCDTFPDYTPYLFVIKGSVSDTLLHDPTIQVVEVIDEEFSKFIDEIDSTLTHIPTNEKEICLLRGMLNFGQWSLSRFLVEFNERNKTTYTKVCFLKKFRNELRLHKERLTKTIGEDHYIESNRDRKEVFAEFFKMYFDENETRNGFVPFVDLLTAFNDHFHRVETPKTLRKRIVEAELQPLVESRSIDGIVVTAISIGSDDHERKARFIRETLEGRYMLRDEFLALFNDHFHCQYSSNNMTREFRAMFEYDKNGVNLKRIKREGVSIRVFMLKRNKEEEEAFIRETIGDGQYIREEFVELFNDHFHADYNVKDFSMRFGPLFIFDKTQCKRVSIDHKSVSVYELKEKSEEFYRSFNLSKDEFNERFHRYESVLSYTNLRKHYV